MNATSDQRRPSLLRWIFAGLALGTLWGLLAGAKHALGSDHVREFQAGDAAPLAERLGYVLQRTGLEAAGFGLLFAAVGVLGLIAALACPGPEPRRTWSGRLLALLALLAWAGPGAYFAREWLPFLSSGELVRLNLVGLGLPLLGLALGARLHARALGERAPDPLARTLALMVGLGAGAAGALIVLRTAEPWRAPVPLALAAGALVAGPLATWPLALIAQRALGGGAQDPAVASPAAQNTDTRGAEPQSPAIRLIAVAGLLCTLATGFLWRATGSTATPEYARLDTDAAPGPNVILLVIDTLRADALGCYGYERPTSPNIDGLAANGTLFQSASSPAAWTKPSTATLLTGLHPSRHGALHHGSRLRLPEGETALAEEFRAAGLATAAFVTNPNIKRVFEFDRGFQEFFDSPVEDTVSLAALRDSASGQLLIRLSRHQFNWKYENDVFSMNEHVFAWLERNADQRFFLYLHYIDPHAPYAPPEPFRSEFVQDHGFVVHNERKRKVGRDLYDGEVRTFDEGFGELIEQLAGHGVLDDTVIAITADHGEEWYEFGIVGHGTSLYEPVIGVPMIFAGPGVSAGHVSPEPVQTLDLPATLLDLAGLDKRALGDGVSFAPWLDPAADPGERALFLENEFGMGHAVDNDFVLSGLRRGPYKLILTERHRYRSPSAGHPAQEFYNLSADPAEQDNLIFAEEHQERIGRMVRELLEHSEFLAAEGLRDDAPAVMDEATRDQLKALGYLGDDE
jgi:arylsulfatase A-like enzyme